MAGEPSPAKPPHAIGRRRMLWLLAAAPGIVWPGSGPGRAAAPLQRWQGQALGARASLTLHHADPAAARRLIRLALAEVARLEQIFSLYRADSQIVQLNRDGRLARPALELVDLLGRARRWSRLTGGAFDVTVQPLWRLYRDHFARPGAAPEGPSESALAAARRRVDYRLVEAGPRAIRFARTGMAVTLNGIAQGYITDRVTELLRNEGLDRVLAALGEIRGHGGHPDGGPWRIGLRLPGESAGSSETIEFADGALATSAAAGLRFDAAGRFHHLLDARRGRPAGRLLSASVQAAEACAADALSTALVAGAWPKLRAQDLRALGVTRIIGTDAQGAGARFPYGRRDRR